MKLKQLLSVLLVALLVLSLAACSPAASSSAASKPSSTVSKDENPTSSEAEKIVFPTEDNPVTITLYPANANLTSGTVTGWRGDFFRKQGLVIEVWAYSDDRTNAILASGTLPDIMYTSDKNLVTMIEGNMLLDLTDYVDDMLHVSSNSDVMTALSYVKKFDSADTGKLYYMPLQVGPGDVGTDTERYALKLNWEAYKAVGSPEITDVYSLIDVVKKMKEACPTTADGTKMEGAWLCSGQDAKYFGGMLSWYGMMGYSMANVRYLIETDMFGETYASILEDNSMYYQGLKWLNALYQNGLLAEDSISTDRPTTQSLVKDAKAVLMPLIVSPGWAPTYMQIYVEGEKIYYHNFSDYGITGISVNAKTENLEACLAFLDMLATPEAYLVVRDGPDGEYWYTADDGHAYPTEKALDCARNGEKFVFSDGSPKDLWNTSWIINLGTLCNDRTDGNGNPRVVRAEQWDEILEIANSTETMNEWRKLTGYDNWVDLLNDKKALKTESKLENVTKFAELLPETMELTVSSLKDAVVSASWNMVYAKTDAEFEALWAKMVKDCTDLGAQSVIDWRLDALKTAMDKKNSI